MLSIINEENYAKDMLENGWLDKKRGQALYILAKYYRFCMNLTKAQTKNKLIDFCNVNVDNYYSSDMYINVNKAISRAWSTKAFLVRLDSIVVEKETINYFNSLKDISEEDKRLLFIILCLVKMTQITETRSETIYWTSNDPNYRFIRKVGGFSSKFNIYVELHNLVQLGYIKTSDYKSTIYATFMENLPTSKDGEVFIINDLETLGYWWDMYVLNDKKIIRCPCCQKLLKRKSNRQVLCKDCREELVKDYKSEWYQENKKIFFKK